MTSKNTVKETKSAVEHPVDTILKRSSQIWAR